MEDGRLVSYGSCSRKIDDDEHACSDADDKVRLANHRFVVFVLLGCRILYSRSYLMHTCHRNDR